MPPLIRPLADGEQPAVIALWQACGLTRPWNDPAQDIERALGSPGSTLLVAELDAEIVGSVMTGYDGHRGWMYYLATHPSLQRRGVARSLVAAAEAWLRDRGCPKAQLMVRHGNEAALAFYDSLGYETQATHVLGRWLSEPPAPPESAIPRQIRGGSKA